MKIDEKELLKRIIANQVVIYAMLSKIEKSSRGVTGGNNLKFTLSDLNKEADKIISEL